MKYNPQDFGTKYDEKDVFPGSRCGCVASVCRCTCRVRLTGELCAECAIGTHHGRLRKRHIP